MPTDMISDYLTCLKINDPVTTMYDVQLLIKRHIAAFAFTSIPVLFKEELSLDLAQIINKIVTERRGGYCFEHNKLMYEVLKASGFEVKALFGRVLLNRDITVPKTHRVTLLTYEGERYLVDVGFGYDSPSMPIKFGSIPTTTHLGKNYRVKAYEDGRYELQILADEKPFTLYSFDLHDYNEADFEVGHFYSHKHPKAIFVNNLVISKILEDEIRTLVNGDYRKISSSGEMAISIDSQEHLKSVLESDFDYPIKVDELKSLYERFVINRSLDDKKPIKDDKE